MFILEDGRLTGEQQNAPYVLIKEYFEGKGIPVQTGDCIPEKEGGSKKIYISMGYKEIYKKLAKRSDVIVSAFFAMECPIVEPRMYESLGAIQSYFKRIMSWSDSPSLERFVGAPIKCELFRWPQSFNEVHEEIWNRTDRKFLVMINGNKLPRLYWKELYTERLKAIEFFNRTGDIDLYGINWGSIPYRVGKTRIPYTAKRIGRYFAEIKQKLWPNPLYVAAAAAYKGTAKSKSETLSRYNFAICFENCILKGWITEKIFDCFFAGTVPVYWGAPEILELVPEDCFIDMRKFKNYSELQSFLHSLSPGDIKMYKEAGRDYINSKQFDPFRKESFLNLFRRIVREDAGVDV